MKRWLPLAATLALTPLFAVAQAPSYSIHAIRYATIPQFAMSGLIPGSPPDQRIDIAMVIWVIRGEGRVILFDAGFYRQRWIDQFKVTDFMRPDSALRSVGINPDSVTDIIVSHAHWDHMGGIDLFPAATVWIQKDEYRYYTMDAWQPGGRRGGIDPDDIVALFRKHAAGKVRMVPGDSAEVVPGIRAFTGSRHTFASQYIRVDGALPYVLASDNAYLYKNIEDGLPSATFSSADLEGNRAQVARMIRLAGERGRVVPGHDALQFARYPARGRLATIRN